MASQGRLVLTITVSHFYAPELPPVSIHTFEAPSTSALQWEISPQPSP